jgi:hypothetical protein
MQAKYFSILYLGVSSFNLSIYPPNRFLRASPLRVASKSALKAGYT